MENDQTQTVATSGKMKFPIGAIFLILSVLPNVSWMLGLMWHALSSVIVNILLIILAVLLLLKKRNNLLLITIGGIVLCEVWCVIQDLLYHNFHLLQMVYMLLWVTIGLFLLMNINEKFASLKDKKKIFDIVFIVLVVLYAVSQLFSIPENNRDFDMDMVRYLFPVILYVLSFIFVKSWIVNPYVKETNYDNVDVVNSEQYISLGKHIALLLFTCGVWQMIWIYKVTGYTNSAKNHKQRTPATALLLNLFVPFYSIYWTFQTAKKIDTLAQEKKIQSDLGTVCLILSIFVPFVPPILMQDKINQIVTGVGTVTPVAVSDAESIEKYKELFDKGVITEEEFNAKKKQLLGL